MAYMYILIACTALSLLLFALPKRVKLACGTLLMCIAALAGLCVGVGVLSGLIEGMHLDSFSRNIAFGWTRYNIDKLSAFFIVVMSIVGIATALYSHGHLSLRMKDKSNAHLSLQLMSTVLLYISMVSVVAADDAYTFLLSWELMTITSFLLVLFNAERREVRRAALNYLVLMHIGFVFLVVGFTTVGYAVDPVMDANVSIFEKIANYMSTHNSVPLYVVFLIGFGMKAGVFPMHTWLPETYPAAPSYVSAFLSGAVSKMGIYGIIRVLACTDSQLLGVGLALFVAGVVTGLWGAFMCTLQNDIKRLLAYSSIENIGIIVLAIGVAAIGRALENDFVVLCAMSGALLHIVNHSLFKSLLFFGAGNVYIATGTTSLNALGGLARRMPVTAVLFLVGCLAISAMPLFNGFVSEFLIYYGLFDAIAENNGGIITAICGVVALSLIGGAVLLAFTKLYGMVFLGSERSHAVEHAEEVGRLRLAACVIPVAGILLIGLAPMLLTEGLFSLSGEVMSVENAVNFTQWLDPQVMRISLVAGIVILVCGLLLLYRRRVLKGRVQERTPVWGCGFTAPNARMQYTGESFSEGIFGVSGQGAKSADSVGKGEIFPHKHGYNKEYKDRVSTLFGQWRVEVMKRISIRVMKYNTGKVNHYILYALSFLALIFLLSVLNLI